MAARGGGVEPQGTRPAVPAYNPPSRILELSMTSLPKALLRSGAAITVLLTGIAAAGAQGYPAPQDAAPPPQGMAPPPQSAAPPPPAGPSAGAPNVAPPALQAEPIPPPPGP